MNKTREFKTDQKIAVDIGTLQSMLCVGRNAANRIAEESGAVLHVGRRKLYSVPKIERYIESLTEG